MEDPNPLRTRTREIPTIRDDMLEKVEPDSEGRIPSISDEMLEPAEAAPSESRADFEKGMSLFPRATLFLIFVNIVVFGFEMAKGTLDSTENILRAGALSKAHVAAGQYWRLGSSMFLHGGFDHLFGNCVALYVLGVASEHAYGMPRTLLLYLAAGLGGGLVSNLLNPGPSVGASGAVFGLMGVMIVFFRKHGKHFILRDNRVGIVLVIWAAYSILTAFAQTYVDNAAHIGGLVTGALLGWFVPAAIAERTQPTPPGGPEAPFG